MEDMRQTSYPETVDPYQHLPSDDDSVRNVSRHFLRLRYRIEIRNDSERDNSCSVHCRRTTHLHTIRQLSDVSYETAYVEYCVGRWFVSQYHNSGDVHVQPIG